MSFLKGLFGKKDKASTSVEAKPESKAKKTVVTILRETVLKSQVDAELSDRQKLELVELLRNIYNTGFSRESIRAAAKYPHATVRKYVEDFLHEVDEQK